MAIKYFPNSVHKKNTGSIDRVLAKRQVRTVRGYQNTTSTALDAYISANSDWQVDSIKFNFSNTASRTYSVKVASGIKIVAELNDTLWFQTKDPATWWQRITLSPGFYTGDTLATELQTQLNANASYVAEGLTFTVAYDDITGLFVITPSAGTIRYLQTAPQPLPIRDSMGGHVVGLTTDTAFAANVTSDTAQFGLNTESWIIDETGSVLTEHYNDDIHVLSIDQALHLASNVSATEVNYEVTYEEIV